MLLDWEVDSGFHSGYGLYSNPYFPVHYHSQESSQLKAPPPDSQTDPVSLLQSSSFSVPFLRPVWAFLSVSLRGRDSSGVGTKQ